MANKHKIISFIHSFLELKVIMSLENNSSKDYQFDITADFYDVFSESDVNSPLYGPFQPSVTAFVLRLEPQGGVDFITQAVYSIEANKLYHLLSLSSVVRGFVENRATDSCLVARSVFEFVVPRSVHFNFNVLRLLLHDVSDVLYKIPMQEILETLAFLAISHRRFLLFLLVENNYVDFF